LEKKPGFRVQLAFEGSIVNGGVHRADDALLKAVENGGEQRNARSGECSFFIPRY